VTGSVYFLGAVALGVVYVAAGGALAATVTERRAWRLFSVSVLYLPALLTLMVLDKLGA
jgi:heme O synthase-like polyprenyltransferase